MSRIEPLIRVLPHAGQATDQRIAGRRIDFGRSRREARLRARRTLTTGMFRQIE
jgi:hypothetical protein